MKLKISKPFDVAHYELEVADVECPYCQKTAKYRWLNNIQNTNKCKHCKKEFFFGYTFMEDDEDTYHYMKCIDCGRVHCKGDLFFEGECQCKESVQVYVDNSDGNIKGDFVKEGDVYEEYEGYEGKEDIEDYEVPFEEAYADHLSDLWSQNISDNRVEVYCALVELVRTIKSQSAITHELEVAFIEASLLVEKIEDLN